MSALVVASPSELATMLGFAKELAASDLLPRQYQRRPANVLFAIEYGRTIGITALAAITGVHVIDGKPTASSALISALVRRAGHKLRVTGNALSATATIVRSDDLDFVFSATWDLERAGLAGLTGKPVWKNYPAAMLKARAITEAARDACQEALLGLLYTPEELGVAVDADGQPLLSPTGDYINGEVVDTSTTALGETDIAMMCERISTVPVSQLRPVGEMVGLAGAWDAPCDGRTLRQILVQRLGDEARAAKWRGPLREVWLLAKGFSLLEDEHHWAEDGEPMAQLLGNLLTTLGALLPSAQPAAHAPATQADAWAALDGEILDAVPEPVNA